MHWILPAATHLVVPVQYPGFSTLFPQTTTLLRYLKPETVKNLSCRSSLELDFTPKVFPRGLEFSCRASRSESESVMFVTSSI